jgi:hypothetical protein
MLAEGTYAMKWKTEALRALFVIAALSSMILSGVAEAKWG